MTYRPTDDLTLFGPTNGATSQAHSTYRLPPVPDENNSFGDEKVKGGEIGLKSRLLDRSLIVNLAAYYYRYAGLQVGANVHSGVYHCDPHGQCRQGACLWR